MEDLSEEELRNYHIVNYFDQTYKYEEIVKNLQSHGICISLRQLKRIIKSLGLKRRNIEEDLDEITSALITELQESGQCLGYKLMWLRLRLKYKLPVYRQTVLELMQVLDPEGIEERSRYRLKRRSYTVPGSNYIWHLDGYDKLRLFGLYIHGCSDGYSRKVMWLQVATTNKKPEVITYYYLTALKKFKTIPTLVRSDKGTENCSIELLHSALRFHHGDDFAGSKSFLKGKSTANQRIESFWGRMRKHSINFWINFLNDLRFNGLLDTDDQIQIDCIRYCFRPLIQYDLDMVRNEWNRHVIRKQNTRDVISGKPNYIYYHPEEFGGELRGFDVHDEDFGKIEKAFEEYADIPVFCGPEFIEMIKICFPDLNQPKNVEDAKNVYLKLIEEIPVFIDAAKENI